MGAPATFVLSGSSGTGYLALPDKPGPAVIVIQEWWGLVGHIKSIVDRLASEGFLAFAPDLYHGQIATEPDIAKKLLLELELDGAANEIQSAATYLLSLEKCSSRGVSIIGYCMGGTLAIWSATHVAEINKAVAYYPGSSWERHNPLWSAFKNKSALIHCAEGDGTSAAPGIQEAMTEIQKAGGKVVAYDYANTQHAFFNDDRPEVYDCDAAELAWQRTIAYISNSNN